MTKPLEHAQAADLAGLTIRRMHQLRQEPGDPPPESGGGYPCVEFGQWLKRRHLAGLGVTNDGAVYDYDAERARLTHHSANKAELEEAALRGELIAASAVASHWGDMCAAMRAKLLTIPSALAGPIAAAAGDMSAIQNELTNAIAQALAELSGDGLPNAGGTTAGDAEGAPGSAPASKVKRSPVGRRTTRAVSGG